jgi:hypothetical protein
MRRTPWRIERHRHRARQQDTHEAFQEGQSGWQHEGHGFPRRNPRLLQRRSPRSRLGQQPSVVQLLVSVAAQEQHVATFSSLLGMPVQDVKQGQSSARQLDSARAGRCQDRSNGVRVGDARRCRSQDPQQIPRRPGHLRRRLRQADAESLFQAQHQFNARQAVNTQAALKIVVQRWDGSLWTSQLAQQ